LARPSAGRPVEYIFPQIDGESKNKPAGARKNIRRFLLSGRVLRLQCAGNSAVYFSFAVGVSGLQQLFEDKAVRE
jgi:hypothetical protein